MQRFEPHAAGSEPGIAAIESGRVCDPYPWHDGPSEALEEGGPADLGHLIAALQAWAQRDRDSASDAASDSRCKRPSGRFHYLLCASAKPGDLPDPARLAARLARLAEPLPPDLASALLWGWPPPVRGLHRIELVPGQAWVSVALGLAPALQRRIDTDAAHWRHEARRRSDTRQTPDATGAPDSTDALDAADSPDAIVVGAGLAGCAMADALTRRGLRVTLIEATARTGGVAGGIPLLAQHPALSPGADRRSRLLVAALLTSDRLAGRLAGTMERCGRFQPMAFAEAQRRAASVAPEIVQAVTRSVSAIHGVADESGLWFPLCALADPGQWWRQVRHRPGLTLRLSTPVAAIRRLDRRWQALDAAGKVLAAAPVMILANQAHAFTLAQMDEVASGRLRRGLLQVAVGIARTSASRTKAGVPAAPRPILGGKPYLLERPGRDCVVGLRSDTGGTLGRQDLDSKYDWRLSVPAERLLLRDSVPMIGAVPAVPDILAQRDRFERNDRLPLPRRDGLYLMTGLGGRGLLWSVLGAEIIAAAMNDEPPLIEPDLLQAIDPARFVKRMLQRTKRQRVKRA